MSQTSGPLANLNHGFRARHCPICGSRGATNIYPIDKAYASSRSGVDISDVPVSVARCRGCGHQYIQPVPEPEFLRAFYENYLSMAKEGFYRNRAQEEISSSLRRRYGYWLTRVWDLADGARLLDVGSGLGTFLRLAREQGFEVAGIEPNREAAATVRQKQGVPVHNCMLEDLEASSGYDVVTMWDLLEHLPDPGGAVVKVGEILSERGLLVMETPARDSFIHWLVKGVYRVSAGRIRSPLFKVCGVHHLQYFSENSLQDFLVDHGFEVLEVHRDQTEVEALYRQYRGGGAVERLKVGAYNLLMQVVFLLARLTRRQNKLVVFARKSGRNA